MKDDNLKEINIAGLKIGVNATVNVNVEKENEDRKDSSQ